MAVIGTFSSFTTARLAIYASQASLNVTGNNIANINTEGYTRQRMDLVSLYSIGAGKYKSIFNTNIGYGVLTKGTSQLRDPYLDIRYRNENAKLGANSEKLDGLTQMSRILDEVGKGTGEKEGFGVIEAQFGSLFQALENLKVNVGSPEYDDLVRTEADILTTYFNQAAKDLQDIRDNKTKEIHEQVADINKLLTDIRDLNDQIRTQAIYGDNALELKDARNMSLDKLSEYMHINVEYSMERIDQFTEVEKLTVTLAGSKGPDGNPIKLVDGIFGGQISIPENVPVENPNYDPVAINREKEQIRKEAGDNNPLSNWEAGINKQIDDMRQAGATEEEIEAKEKELWSEARRQRQGIIDDAVQRKEDELVAAGGKYVKTKADPDANPPVKAEYTNDPEEALTFANDKYLIQVEPLKDRRDRLMIDPNTVSKESEQVELDDVVLYGKLQAIREMLTEEGEYASADDIAMDPNAALKRGIPYYQKALDNLARKVAEVFNQENQLPAETVYQMSEDGAFLKKDGAPGECVTDDRGKAVTKERLEKLAEKAADPDATAEEKAEAEAETAICLEALRRSGTKDPLYEFYDGGALFSNNGNGNDTSGITAANISVSASWANGSVRVLNDKRPDDYQYAEDGETIIGVIKHSSRNDNIRHMISMYNQQLDYYATDVQPDAASKLPVLSGSFREVFTAISGTLADDQQATTGKVTSYSITTLNLENDRQSVSGVDLNEEATSMMQFSKSYSAACRLLTTIDSMLDKLINGTAV